MTSKKEPNNYTELLKELNLEEGEIDHDDKQH
ncbi:hypothetical protein ERAQ111492_05300 [Erysipelothrix aquatica]